jgi:hypothetical protein
MKTIWRLAALFFVLTMLLMQWGSANAQSVDVQYFPETGHQVKGDFLGFYKSVQNPQLVFGYPITEQMNSRDGKTVQYFQRARFELRPDLPENQRIQLTSVGQALYRPANQLKLGNTAGCDLFATGYSVCFTFLDFYKANGGAAQFGDPISPFELGEDPAQLKAVKPLDATINAVLSIKVRAFVLKPLTRTTGQQTVYVIVQSQTLQAVSNATGKATITWPDGRTEDYFFTTDNSGLGKFSFNFSDQKQGELVPIDIVVLYQGLSGTTRTSFRIWF